MKPLSLDEIPDNHPLHPRVNPNEPEPMVSLVLLRARLSRIADWFAIAKEECPNKGLAFDCICYLIHQGKTPNDTIRKIAKTNRVAKATVEKYLTTLRRM